jgi:hypothetical protein
MKSKWLLTVTYKEREEAKAKGCRWDPKVRSWYLEGEVEAYRRLPEAWRQCDPEVVETPKSVPVGVLDGVAWEYNGRYWYRQTPGWCL